MAVLATSNWAVSGRITIDYGTRQKRTFAKVVLTSGHYPAGGLAVPNPGFFGLVRNLDFLSVVATATTNTAATQNILWRYDKNKDTLRGFVNGTTSLVTGAVGQGRTKLAELNSRAIAKASSLTRQVLHIQAVGW